MEQLKQHFVVAFIALFLRNIHATRTGNASFFSFSLLTIIPFVRSSSVTLYLPSVLKASMLLKV